jgi:chemotaxis methyl-accepting protein methylase
MARMMFPTYHRSACSAFSRAPEGSYRIVKSIRDLCVFATHNVAKDPPFSRIDIISCCNLLIYLDTALQRKLMATFHYALNSDGYLVLGKSETVGSATSLICAARQEAEDIFQEKRWQCQGALRDGLLHARPASALYR